MAGQLVHKVDPTYLPVSHQEHVSGALEFHVIVGKDGTGKEVTVISGPEYTRAKAMEALRQWVYRLYLLNGEPVEVDTTVIMNIDFGG